MGKGLKTKKLMIGGMTCAGCQNKIEKKLKNTAGIHSVNVGYAEGTAEIVFDPALISLDRIGAVIEALGYEVPAAGAAGSEARRAAGIFVILLAVFMVLKACGLAGVFEVFPTAEAGMGYGMLFVIGALTSVHCVAMCGGINLSQSMPRPAHPSAAGTAVRLVPEGVPAGKAAAGRTKPAGKTVGAHTKPAGKTAAENTKPAGKTAAGRAKTGGRFEHAVALRPALLYNTGRVLSYTSEGFIVGALGSVFAFSLAFQAGLKLIAGIFMLIMGVNMLGAFAWARRFAPRMPKPLAARLDRRRAASGGPFAVGLLNGLMPCGPLQAMQIYALSTGSPAKGALSMFLFAMGTVPLVLGIGALGSILSRKFTRNVMTAGAALVVLLGISMLSQAWGLSGGSLLPPKEAAARQPGISALPQENADAGPPGVSGLPPGDAAGAPDVSGLPPGNGADAPDVSGLPEDAAGRAPGMRAVPPTAEASVEDGVQIVNSTLARGKYPKIAVQAGMPVRWVIDAPSGSISGCNGRMIIPEYGIQHDFEEGENVIEFTPDREGEFMYSCWMGMIRSTITVVAQGGR
ncbi:MAG: sulfite exporter TauE/SafE family protein [Clostridiales Family XIII bacterium]|jgi:sulfite exporter TauE/SafE|nr:sulfite exporter TauE/SafE family protein [Clostridiales Family XIII bacterium]